MSYVENWSDIFLQSKNTVKLTFDAEQACGILAADIYNGDELKFFYCDGTRDSLRKFEKHNIAGYKIGQTIHACRDLMQDLPVFHYLQNMPMPLFGIYHSAIEAAKIKNKIVAIEKVFGVNSKFLTDPSQLKINIIELHKFWHHPLRFSFLLGAFKLLIHYSRNADHQEKIQKFEEQPTREELFSLLNDKLAISNFSHNREGYFTNVEALRNFVIDGNTNFDEIEYLNHLKKYIYWNDSRNTQANLAIGASSLKSQSGWRSTFSNINCLRRNQIKAKNKVVCIMHKEENSDPSSNILTNNTF